jgi:Leucine-rich repeat (LRR) protein
LNVSRNPLKWISPEVSKMPNMQMLSLSSTDRSIVFPKEIWGMTNLTRLRLLDLNIDEVPSAIGNMKRLEELNLLNNRIQSVPPELAELPLLTYLSLANNQFAVFPREICNAKLLYYLAVYGNTFETVPDEIENLKKLEFLACWETGLNQKEQEKLERLLPANTKMNFTGEGIH